WLWMKLRPVRLGKLTTCVVDPAEPEDEKAVLTRSEARALAALGKVRKTSPDWKDKSGLAKQSFYDAKSGLLAKGLVLKIGRYYQAQSTESPESGTSPNGVRPDQSPQESGRASPPRRGERRTFGPQRHVADWFAAPRVQ